LGNALRDQTVLDVIRVLSSRGESGRLQITSGMTDAAVFIDRGDLVDARFAKLTGFQAINALASLRDVTFSFDPAITPPTQSSITPNERILLRDFFGIGGANQEPQYPPFEGHEEEPAQVVLLSEVDEPENLNVHKSFVTPVVTPLVTEASSLSPPSFTESATATQDSPDYYDDQAVVSDEATIVRSRKTPRAENQPAITYGPPSRSRVRPALFATMLTILVAGAAFALVYRLRGRSSPTPATVQTSTDAGDQQVSNGSTTPATAQTSNAAGNQQVSNGSTTPATVQTSTPASDPQVSTSRESPSVTPDLNGTWNVTNTVEQTAYQPYKNMEVGFELAINQTGNEFTGKGQKVSENGQSLPGTSRTPIIVRGSIEGDKVRATFSESGATRKTSGRFVWRIDRAKGGLTGTFASDAARSRGRSAATKRF